DDGGGKWLAALTVGDGEIRPTGDRSSRIIGGENAERGLERRRSRESLGHRAVPVAARAAPRGPKGAFGSAAPSSPVVIARQTRSGAIGRRRTRAPGADAVALPADGAGRRRRGAVAALC